MKIAYFKGKPPGDFCPEAKGLHYVKEKDKIYAVFSGCPECGQQFIPLEPKACPEGLKQKLRTSSKVFQL